MAKSNSSKKNKNKTNAKQQEARNNNKNAANIKKQEVTIKEDKKLNKQKNAKVNDKQKEAKVKKQSIKKTTMTKNDSEITKLVKIVLIVTAIMVIFYGITLLVTKNRSSNSSSENSHNEKAVIQYDDIMIGTMLNKNDDWYYVLIKEDEDNRMAEYETLMKLIASKEDAPKIYTANLTDSFNKKYLAKEANESSDMSEFRVTGTTLVEIKDGQIANIYSNHDDIKGELDALAK